LSRSRVGQATRQIAIQKPKLEDAPWRSRPFSLKSSIVAAEGGEHVKEQSACKRAEVLVNRCGSEVQRRSDQKKTRSL
jgi:hypothetical protein